MDVLIVEDEARIRDGLKKLLERMDGDYRVVGNAEDGREGLKLAEELRPDVIITDIRMPEMDGLEMLERITEAGIPSKAIVLSAFSEFEYARKAMKLGVTEYLLKPISVGEFSQALLNVRAQIEKDRQEKPQTIGTLEQIFRDLIGGNIRMDPEIGRYLESSYGIGSTQPLILLCAYLGIEYEEHREEIRRYLQHALSSYPDIAFEISDMESGKSLAIVIYRYRDAHDLERWVQSQLLQKKTRRLTLGFIIAENAEALGDSWRALSPCMDWNIALDEEILISYPKITRIFTAPCSYPMELETRMKVSFCASDWQKAEACIREFHGRFGGGSIYAPKEIKDSYVRFLWAMMEIAKELGCAGTEAVSAQVLLDQIMTAKKREELFAVTESVFQTVWMKTAEEDTVGLTVRRVRSMIHEFYQSGITLEEIGDKLHVSPEYLGTQFRKEVGVFFNTYMRDYRVQKAKELLCGTQLKLYEIAERIGYSDPKYFSKVFKEATGLLPAEYRKTYK